MKLDEITSSYFLFSVLFCFSFCPLHRLDLTLHIHFVRATKRVITGPHSSAALWEKTWPVFLRISSVHRTRGGWHRGGWPWFKTCGISASWPMCCCALLHLPAGVGGPPPLLAPPFFRFGWPSCGASRGTYLWTIYLRAAAPSSNSFDPIFFLFFLAATAEEQGKRWLSRKSRQLTTVAIFF